MKNTIIKSKFMPMLLLALILVGTVIPSYADSNNIGTEIFYFNEEGNKVIIGESNDSSIKPMAFPCCKDYRDYYVIRYPIYRHYRLTGTQEGLCEIESNDAIQCLACNYIAYSNSGWYHDGYHSLKVQPGYKGCPNS